jgi:hypothetical protein
MGNGFFFPNEMRPAGADFKNRSGSALNVSRQDIEQK